MTNGSLMKVKSIAECSWSILQYFWHALSDNWSWKPIFGLFESGRFTQVLLHYIVYFLGHYLQQNPKFYVCDRPFPPNYQPFIKALSCPNITALQIWFQSTHYFMRYSAHKKASSQPLKLNLFSSAVTLKIRDKITKKLIKSS